MRNTGMRVTRWIAVVAATLALAACGGGGGDGGADAPAPDARNGSYTMVAANAQVYTLDLDFDDASFSVTGTGVNQTGTFAIDGSGSFAFSPGNSKGTTGTTTLRFSYVDEAVVGGFAVGDDVVPFVAARNFATTVAEIVGTYNLLARTVDSAGPENTLIQQGEITAGGQFRACADTMIMVVANCPQASLSEGPVTVEGNVFSATTPTGRIEFRVARIGGENIYLRASPSLGTTRRFAIGTPAGTTYAAGSFKGASTDGTWGTASVRSSAYASDVVNPAGVRTIGTGSARPIGAGTSLGNLVVISDTEPDIGALFSIRSSRLGVLVAARNNALVPGLVAIGVRQ